MISKIVATLVCLLFIALANNGDQNLLYKPAVNKIQLDGGEIADCIDIYKQPSLDHPLLKDHKLQMPPQSYAARRMKQLEAIMPKNKVCPFGTVPILRTTKEDQAIAGAINPPNIYPSINGRQHRVFLYLKQGVQDGGYIGASGFTSIYNFTITKPQHSSAFIGFQNGPNYVLIGWIVGLHGDSNPRLFIFWSADNGNKTGCYNLHCKGFVQVDRSITLGQILQPVSVYGGPTAETKIKLFQDKRTGNWQFLVGKKETLVGYLPKELLQNLTGGGARILAWGGESFTGDDGISPPMGSGHKPDGFYNHAAYFRNNLCFARTSPHNNNDTNESGLFIDPSNCFGIVSVRDPPQYSNSVVFGGPGGKCD